MKKTNYKKVIMIFILLHIVANIFAQSEDNLEERILALEQEIENIKEILSELNPAVYTYSSKTSTNNEIVYNSLDCLPITTKLKSLSYNESNASNNFANYYNDWIGFTFMFKNNLEKTISAAKGSVVFMDVFGEKWWSIGLTLNDTIEPGETIEWTGQTDYNGFLESHKIARHTDPEDVMVRYDVTQMIFKDGTKQTFE